MDVQGGEGDVHAAAAAGAVRCAVAPWASRGIGPGGRRRGDSTPRGFRDLSPGFDSPRFDSESAGCRGDEVIAGARLGVGVTARVDFMSAARIAIAHSSGTGVPVTSAAIWPLGDGRHASVSSRLRSAGQSAGQARDGVGRDSCCRRCRRCDSDAGGGRSAPHHYVVAKDVPGGHPNPATRRHLLADRHGLGPTCPCQQLCLCARFSC